MQIATIGETLYWSYANLAMAHAAVSRGAPKFSQLHFIIRSRLFHGLLDGRMNIGALADDERLKLVLPRACCYCGSRESLAVDHLIPRHRGGADTGDNMVWACRSCNSSKGSKDVLVWLSARGEFPPLLLLRRYLKLSIEYCEVNGLLDHDLAAAPDMPFRLEAIPHKFPAPQALELWRIPLDTDGHDAALIRARA